VEEKFLNSAIKITVADRSRPTLIVGQCRPNVYGSLRVWRYQNPTVLLTYIRILHLCVYHGAAAEIWFEIWGVMDPGKEINFFQANWRTNNFDLSRQIDENFDYFQAKISEWPFFLAIYFKMSVYPDRICHLGLGLQLNSSQIILYRLKSHHFRTYFLYMITYNNVSRPPATTPRPPSQKSWGVVTPILQDWRLCHGAFIL